MSNNSDGINKPPLGLRPKYLFDADFDNLFRNRALEILDAMRRYVEDDKSIPTEWTDELLGILDWVGNKT